jgi:hypothetical protein
MPEQPNSCADSGAMGGQTRLHAERKMAAQLGLKFLHQISLDDEVFDDWAGDFLWCFYCLATTTREPVLRDTAKRIGVQLARKWYAMHSSMPDSVDADDVLCFLSIVDTARRLGVRNARFESGIRKAIPRFKAQDYLDFNPRKEAPPTDLFDPCPECGLTCARGIPECKCGAGLVRRSRFEVWRIALVLTYTADGFGSPLGASYAEVFQWIQTMRPYVGYCDGANPDFSATAYAVTHVVYTLNDYHRHRLLPDWLPEEFEFLVSNMNEVLRAGDIELFGEFVDSLRAFGLPESDPLIQNGIEYLLSNQNSDGSWGDVDEPDARTRCHTTWTAIDGLRDYDWSDRTTVPKTLKSLGPTGAHFKRLKDRGHSL